MSSTRSELYYSFRTDFQNWKGNQDFGRQNISMNPIGTNTTKGTTSPIDSIPVRTKTPHPTPRTQPTELSTQPTDPSKRKEKAYLPADPESNPSFSDSSSSESDFSGDSSYRKSKEKKRNTNKKG